VLKAASLCDSEGLPLQLELFIFTGKTCSVVRVKLQRNLRLSFCLIEIMNLDSLSFALSQISYSVANLTKKNYKSNVTEISTVSYIFDSWQNRLIVYVAFLSVINAMNTGSISKLYVCMYVMID